MINKPKVVYGVSPEYKSIMNNSKRTLYEHNPEADVKVHYGIVNESNPAEYLKPYSLRDLDGPALFLDADTKVNDDINKLPVDDCDVGMRISCCWIKGNYSEKNWKEMFEFCGVKDSAPMYNAGVILFKNITQDICDKWEHYIKILLESDSEKLPNGNTYPTNFKGFDQAAFSLVISDLDLKVKVWDASHHSYEFNNELPGVVHHYGQHNI